MVFKFLLEWNDNFAASGEATSAMMYEILRAFLLDNFSGSVLREKEMPRLDDLLKFDIGAAHSDHWRDDTGHAYFMIQRVI